MLTLALIILILLSVLVLMSSVVILVALLITKVILFLLKKDTKKLKVPIVIFSIVAPCSLFLIIISVIIGPSIDPVAWCSHEYTVIEQQDATCTNNGHIKKVCSLCNNEVIETIDAHHLWVEDRVIEATCSHPKQLINKCSECGTIETVEEGSTLSHSFGDWIISIEPTADKEGQQTRECTVCKYIENASIPKITYIEVTANDLWDAFNENEIAAEQKYNGKTVRVTGVISDINSEDILTSANVLLIVDSTYWGCVQCNFNSNNAKALANLHKGDSITIEGTCGKISVFNLMINACKVIE